MSCCTRLPNLIQIGPPTAEKWCHVDFQDGGSPPSWIFFTRTCQIPGLSRCVNLQGLLFKLFTHNSSASQTYRGGWKLERNAIWMRPEHLPYHVMLAKNCARALLTYLLTYFLQSALCVHHNIKDSRTPLPFVYNARTRIISIRAGCTNVTGP